VGKAVSSGDKDIRQVKTRRFRSRELSENKNYNQNCRKYRGKK
jgi:hypothetical protein